MESMLEAEEELVLDPYLALWLPFPQLDGESFMSRDHYGHLCTNYGSVWSPEGRYFDGVDDYVNCGNHSGLNFGTGSFTIEVVFKPTDFSTTPIFISKYAGGNVGWYAKLNANGTVYFKYGDGSYEDISNTDAFQINESQLLTIVHEVGGNDYIYRNDRKPKVKSAVVYNTDSSSDFVIGALFDLDFKGVFTSVCTYRRAFSATEVSERYAAWKGIL